MYILQKWSCVRNVVIPNITVVGKIIALDKDVQILIPETYKYVILHGKRNFENVIKLSILF